MKILAQDRERIIEFPEGIFVCPYANGEVQIVAQVSIKEELCFVLGTYKSIREAKQALHELFLAYAEGQKYYIM